MFKEERERKLVGSGVGENEFWIQRGGGRRALGKEQANEQKWSVGQKERGYGIEGNAAKTLTVEI